MTEKSAHERKDSPQGLNFDIQNFEFNNGSLALENTTVVVFQPRGKTVYDFDTFLSSWEIKREFLDHLMKGIFEEEIAQQGSRPSEFEFWFAHRVAVFLKARIGSSPKKINEILILEDLVEP